MTRRLSDEWREQAAKAEDRQLRNELRDPYGHGLEQKEVANTLAWVADQYDERHPPGDLDRMRAALQELEAWVSPPTGMGAGLHAEMWTHLTPAARKRLSEIVAALRAVVHSSVGAQELLDLAEQLERAMDEPEPRE